MTALLERLLELGDPRLREVAEPVDMALWESDPASHGEAQRLAETLEAFRTMHGFGRAMAATQIGVRKRMIAFNLPEAASGEARPSGRFIALNPEMTWTSAETFSMWDDCMSFPFLVVRVRRHLSISLRYNDEDGNEFEWPKLDRASSELVQHELDHLDGVLATDRAIDRFSLVSRVVYAKTPQLYRGQVDYCIGE